MSEPVRVDRQRDGHALYIEGYFSNRTWKGERPSYGYPKNHLPEPTIEKMEVEPGFVTAFKSKSK